MSPLETAAREMSSPATPPYQSIGQSSVRRISVGGADGGSANWPLFAAILACVAFWVAVATLILVGIA